MFFKKINENYYYMEGLSGKKELFMDYLIELKQVYDILDLTVFCDYGSTGIEIAETSIYSAEQFVELKQNMVRMHGSLDRLFLEDRKSLVSFYGKNVTLRKGVKDIQIVSFTFSGGLYDCYLVIELNSIARDYILPDNAINLLHAFIYQKQLRDFQKVGYSSDGYLGLPSRDELIKRIRCVGDSMVAPYFVIGVKIANATVLEEKKYRLIDMLGSMISYFNKYYKGDLFALGCDRIAILKSTADALNCVDELEAHISVLSREIPEITLAVNITPVLEEPFTVIYEVEKSLDTCGEDSFVVSRSCRKHEISYADVEEFFAERVTEEKFSCNNSMNHDEYDDVFMEQFEESMES